MPRNVVQTLPQQCRLRCLRAAPSKSGCSSSHLLRRTRRWTPPKALDERQLLGEDFGARDPTAGEKESNFTDKVLGNADTSHIIRQDSDAQRETLDCQKQTSVLYRMVMDKLCRGPKGLEKLVGLATRKCVPCEKGSVQSMDESSAYKLRNQVPGWRVEKTKEGTLCLRQNWKVKNFRCGIDLFKRIGEVAEAEGHHPDLHLEGYSMVSAELSTHSIGGLSENDFIMAAKINSIPMADLQPKAKPRFWA